MPGNYMPSAAELFRFSPELLLTAAGTLLMIFEAISSCDEMNCGEIVSLQGVTHATVSHHLKILAEAGLIEARRDGQFIYNKSIPRTIEDYTNSLRALIGKKRK